MATKLATAWFVLALAACGDRTAPTASGVFPAQGFTGRALRVEISGDATSWQEGATVAFGDDITVNEVEVASPTDVFATITVAPTAPPGKRDVTVSSGGTFTLKQAFELVPPVELVVQGNPGQGGRPSITLENRDFEHPFDTTRDPATGGYANLVLTGPDKVQLVITSASEYTLHGRAFIDLDATTGGVTLTSGTGGSALVSVPQDFAVSPRSPLPISGATIGAITELGDSVLYSVSATGTPSLVHVAVRSSDPSAAVGAAIFTDTTWGGAVGLHELIAGPASVTFVVADIQGAAGYEFDVSAAGEMLAMAAEGNDSTNGTTAGALAAGSLPFEQTGGTLSSAADTDVIAFTVPPAGAMKRAHVLTDAGTDPATDTRIDITDAAGTTSFLQTFSNGHPVDGSECGLFGCLTGDNFGEDVLSDPLPAGTYYLRITAGSLYSSADQPYAALVWLE